MVQRHPSAINFMKAKPTYFVPINSSLFVGSSPLLSNNATTVGRATDSHRVGVQVEMSCDDELLYCSCRGRERAALCACRYVMPLVHKINKTKNILHSAQCTLCTLRYDMRHIVTEYFLFCLFYEHKVLHQYVQAL